MKNIKRTHKIHKTDKNAENNQHLLCRTLVISGNILFPCL